MKNYGNTPLQAAQTPGILPLRANFPEPEKHWFVYRYKTLTTRARDHFRKSSLEVFFPHHQVRRKSELTGKTETVERPVVPCYIFVHAGLDEAINLGKAFDMSLWRRQQPLQVDASKFMTEDSRDLKEYKALKLAERTAAYYTIDEEAMHQLIRVVELGTLDFHILDASDIDLQKDDFVEIAEGDFKGLRGYLKTVNGKGGVIVVPLMEESPINHNPSTLNPQPSTINPQPSSITHSIPLLYYGIPAKATDLSILSFPTGSQRATDLLRLAQLAVDGMMADYANGKKLTVRQTNQLLGYVRRFRHTQFDRPIQRTVQALLLYRIYTILEISTERTAVGEKLEQEIFPDCRQRVELSRNRDREKAEKTLQSYLEKKKEADEAHNKRIQALAEKR